MRVRLAWSGKPPLDALMTSMGRIWPDEWNRMIMETLLEAETTAGRRLTRNEILGTVAKRVEDDDIPMNFLPWRRR